MNKLNWLAAGALLLSACASTTTHDGLVYRDGSWYSPAADGRGDYYTRSAQGEAWDHPYDFSIGLVPYGGYCPVRYRYCTSFWADPFFGPRFGYYDPFYDPYWYRPWTSHRPTRHHRRRPPLNPGAGQGTGVTVVPRERTERPQPRAWEERPPVRVIERDAGSPRPRPRVSTSDDGSE